MVGEPDCAVEGGGGFEDGGVDRGEEGEGGEGAGFVDLVIGHCERVGFLCWIGGEIWI